MWFEGGPLAGTVRDKSSGGRWSTYLDEHGEVLRTVHGDARARRFADGERVSFYRLDGDELVQREVNGRRRTGRVYVHCTLLAERARRAADARAAAEGRPVEVPALPPTAPPFTMSV